MNEYTQIEQAQQGFVAKTIAYLGLTAQKKEFAGTEEELKYNITHLNSIKNNSLFQDVLEGEITLKKVARNLVRPNRVATLLSPIFYAITGGLEPKESHDENLENLLQIINPLNLYENKKIESKFPKDIPKDNYTENSWNIKTQIEEERSFLVKNYGPVIFFGMPITGSLTLPLIGMLNSFFNQNIPVSDNIMNFTLAGCVFGASFSLTSELYLLANNIPNEPDMLIKKAKQADEFIQEYYANN